MQLVNQQLAAEKRKCCGWKGFRVRYSGFRIQRLGLSGAGTDFARCRCIRGFSYSFCCWLTNKTLPAPRAKWMFF